MVDLQPQLEIGARCLVAGKFFATIRYVGPVEGQSGDWVGLEWDDICRGKHDGSHDGRRYFECNRGRSSGSFVRLSKFVKAVEFGSSLIQAVQRRYSDRSAAQEQASELSLSASGSRLVEVELVGADEVAQRLAMLNNLEIASVVRENVSRVADGPEDDLGSAMPVLRELDLSANLIGDWSFVVTLLQSLPSLRSLNLSQNKFSHLPQLFLPPVIPHPAPLPNLTTLVLNSTALDWPQAVALAQQLPNLRELHLAGNAVSTLNLLPRDSGAEPQLSGGCQQQGQSQPVRRAPPSRAPQELHLPPTQLQFPQQDANGQCTSQEHPGAAGARSSETCCEHNWLAAAFPQLKLLDLEDNQISNWGEVQLLCALPALQALQLGGNRLQRVHYNQGFTSLNTLLLGGNLISSWESVDQLDRFPAVADVRLTHNPILADHGTSARYEVVARVGQLTTLNASQVTKMERWDAEINYLRHVTDELAGVGQEHERQTVLLRHPRYAALTAKYGTLAPSLPQSAVNHSMASSLVEIVLSHAGTEITKKLPASLTIGRLKLIIEKLLRVKVAQQALILIPTSDSKPHSMPEDITEDNGKELRYYDPCSGTRIEITEMDPSVRKEALQRAKQAAVELHHVRMEEQEQMIQKFHLVEKGLMAS